MLRTFQRKPQVVVLMGRNERRELYGPMALGVSLYMAVSRGSPKLLRSQHRLSWHRGRQVERREAWSVRDPGRGEAIHRRRKCVSWHSLGGAGPKFEDPRTEMRCSIERPLGSQNLWSIRTECRSDLQQNDRRKLGGTLGCLCSRQVKAMKTGVDGMATRRLRRAAMPASRPMVADVLKAPLKEIPSCAGRSHG